VSPSLSVSCAGFLIRIFSVLATLSLAPIYKKPRDWSAPFPVHENYDLYHHHESSSHESSDSQHVFHPSPSPSPSSEENSHDSPFAPYSAIFDDGHHGPTLILGIPIESSPVPSPSTTLPLPSLTLPTPPPTVLPYIHSPTSDGASTVPYDAGGSSHGTLSPQELPSPELSADYVPMFVHDLDERPLPYYANLLQEYRPDTYVWDNAPFTVSSNAHPQDQPVLYTYRLPLPMDTVEFLLFSEWHCSLRRFMYRFVPTEDLTPFEIAEFVTRSGAIHEEALDITQNLIRLHALGSTERFGRAALDLDAKRDLALQNDAVVQRLRQRSHAQPDERGNVVAALFGELRFEAI
jgi:hypothetical protein